MHTPVFERRSLNVIAHVMVHDRANLLTLLQSQRLKFAVRDRKRSNKPVVYDRRNQTDASMRSDRTERGSQSDVVSTQQ